jgi:hypothetical protein
MCVLQATSYQISIPAALFIIDHLPCLSVFHRLPFPLLCTTPTCHAISPTFGTVCPLLADQLIAHRFPSSPKLTTPSPRSARLRRLQVTSTAQHFAIFPPPVPWKTRRPSTRWHRGSPKSRCAAPRCRCCQSERVVERINIHPIRPSLKTS